jgi:hypothetical protein
VQLPGREPTARGEAAKPIGQPSRQSRNVIEGDAVGVVTCDK